MKDKKNLQTTLELERYELNSPAKYWFAVNRRDFFKFLGAGMVVFCVARDTQAFQESGARRRMDESLPSNISAWLHIGENDRITVYTGKVEVGQNIRTSLTQAVAEELRIAVEKIQLVMGDTKLTPFDMGTFGSRTTPTMNLRLRKVSAAARDLLVDMAAKKWGTEPERLMAADGMVTDPASKRSVTYAELVKGQELTENIPAEDPLISPSDWKVLGQPLPKVDGVDFVTGRHRFPYDQNLPDMLHGKVLRPSAFGATLGSLDTREAEKIPGVVVVHDGNFVGVAAPTVELASRALGAIHAEWKSEPQPSNRDLFEYLKTHPEDGDDPTGGRSHHEVGSVEKALASADVRLHQTYTVNYIAHAPLEPRVALAQWTSDGVTVWTGTQRPFGVRNELMETFHLPEEQVRVLMPDTGAAYGGKHTGETAIEAARLAREAKRPVKVAWTREEEFAWAYFRPAGVIDVSSGLRSDGSILAWEFYNYNSGAAAIQTFYDIPNQRIQFHATHSPLRQGSYRGLAATANHFARESFMDELAHAVKMDPLEFRLKNLKDERLRAVFQAAAKKFGWSASKKEPGHGFGMGGGFEKGGNVATFAEVAVEKSSGQVRVVRIVTAFECGAIANPDNLRNQIEGANIMGLGGALFEAIKFANGRILNGRFSEYRVPRFRDVPPIDVLLLDRKDIPPAGAGETPLVGLAPAIGNAIFDATGVRLRTLPMVPNGLKAS